MQIASLDRVAARAISGIKQAASGEEHSVEGSVFDDPRDASSFLSSSLGGRPWLFRHLAHVAGVRRSHGFRSSRLAVGKRGTETRHSHPMAAARSTPERLTALPRTRVSRRMHRMLGTRRMAETFATTAIPARPTSCRLGNASTSPSRMGLRAVMGFAAPGTTAAWRACAEARSSRRTCSRAVISSDSE